jgi:hypothetical protein
MAPTCFAQRLLNPFRGVMNVIEHEGAEAVTIDGRHWDIYVRDTALVEDLADSHKVQTSDIRYGSWSEKQGLKRGAIYPSDDFKLLEHRGAVVYEYLLAHYRDIPFRFSDTCELWLLDRQHLPLVLLASATGRQHIDLDAPLDWHSGYECARHFRSAATEALNRRDDTSLGAGQWLDRLIVERAGPSPAAQWVQREADGSGSALAGIGLPTPPESRHLPARLFPAFFIADHAQDDPEQRLIQDYLAWQAPCLLLLQTLDPGTRALLERQAVHRALAVEQHYRLYPSVVDTESIQAARVEALLRANDPARDRDEETMATYYIELNVTRTN